MKFSTRPAFQSKGGGADMSIKIINLTKQNTLSESIYIANSFRSRLKGLIGVKKLHKGEGIILIPCNSIHTCFMSVSIDVIFLNKDNLVIKAVENLGTWKMLKIISEASKIIEMRAGSIKEENVSIGDQFELIQ